MPLCSQGRGGFFGGVGVNSEELRDGHYIAQTSMPSGLSFFFCVIWRKRNAGGMQKDESTGEAFPVCDTVDVVFSCEVDHNCLVQVDLQVH